MSEPPKLGGFSQQAPALWLDEVAVSQRAPAFWLDDPCPKSWWPPNFGGFSQRALALWLDEPRPKT